MPAEKLNIDEIQRVLGLHPHQTCGFTNEIYRSSIQIPQADLPPSFDGPRTLGGFLYFLVTTDAPVRLHRIRSDQMYHHYAGEPLEVLLLYPDGSSNVSVLGMDLMAGMRPQLLVPSNTFHAGHVHGSRGYALLGTSVWLRAEPSDVELGDPSQLAVEYPAAKDQILRFTQ
jgi:predicted cupin superfamily sugar epimerase